MKRSLILSMCAVVAVTAFAGLAQAQNVTMSLDLFYRDNDSANNGTWQLYALADSEGLAGLDSQIGGLLGATNETFLASDGTTGFLENIGSVPFNGDQDSNAATLDLLFGQVPVTAGTTQNLVYNAANISAALLGATVDTSGSTVAGGLLLAYGTFGAGSAPALTTGAPAGGSGSNVFTTVGNATTAGTIVQATTATQIRNNTGALGKAGDANLDGDVDVFEFGGQGDASILSSNLGCDAANGDACLWQDGDFSGDRDVDVFEFGGLGDASILSSALGSDSAPGTASATYDRVTGELIFDIGENVAVVGLAILGGGATFDQSHGSNANGINPAQFNDSTLAYFDANGLPAGVFNQGNVLPAGLTAADLGFEFTPVGGQTQTPGVEIVGVVPEPSTLVFVSLGLVITAVRRRQAA